MPDSLRNKTVANKRQQLTNKPHVKQKRGAKVVRKKSNMLKKQKEISNHKNSSTSKINNNEQQNSRDRKIHNIRSMYARLPSLKDIESEEAPKIVVVFGPPKSGKTTFIRTLVHQFSKQKMKMKPVGPITVVTSKSSRLTFVECSRDINKMIDCAKIADTVIFLLDVNTGLESEHLEMKQILNCHGNPPIVAAISHVDVLAQSRSQQNKIMTSLKSRIKSQIDDGTSIVILKNGVLHEGKEYHLNSISVLSQKLSNLKTISRPWRDSSSFVLVDKFEFEPRIDQDSNYADLNLFGFIRGSLMKPGQSVLIPGVGGPFQIDKVTKLNDPCPLKSQHLKKRSLLSTEHLVYCPRALMEQNRAFGNNIKPAAILDDEKAQNSNNELIGGLSKPINIFSGDDRASAKLADGLKQHINSFDVSSTKKIANLKSLDFVDSESFTAPSLGENSKQSLARDSLNSIIVANDKEYMAKIIDKNANLKSALKPESMDMNDSVLSNFQQNYQRILESSKSGREDTVCGFMSKINSLFLTHEVLKQSKVNYKANTSSDDESYDEEIVEVEETLGLLSEEETIADEQTTPQNDQECKTECDSEANEKKCIDKGGKGKFSSGKSDHILDLISNADRQEKIDREFLADNSDSEFGHQTGTYVKIFIKDLPKAIETQLEDSSLLILGSMAPKQVTNSKLKCLIDMHCLQNRPLKSNVASLISFGWFRMQSAGVFCSQAPNLKLRFLKYSPRMVSSYFVFSGPVHEQKTGVVIFSNQNYNFRILATGSIVGSDSSICVQKKLKLIGTPCEIYKKTAMISGMFNSDLEAAKFEGAKLQTVSGIRGVVKKRTKSSMPGTIRAAFEDKISQNDLIFLKTWMNYEIDTKTLFIPDLLLSQTALESWKGFKEDQISSKKSLSQYPFQIAQNSTDDGYKHEEVKIQDKKPIKLKIVKRLRDALPFKIQKKCDSSSVTDSRNLQHASNVQQSVEEILNLNNNRPKEHKKLLHLVEEHKKHLRHNRLLANKKKMALKAKSINNTPSSISKAANIEKQDKRKLVKRLRSIVSKGI